MFSKYGLSGCPVLKWRRSVVRTGSSVQTAFSNKIFISEITIVWYSLPILSPKPPCNVVLCFLWLNNFEGGCTCQSALKHGFHEQCKLECKRKLKVNSSYFTVKRGLHRHRHKHKGKLKKKEKTWSLCLGLCLCLHGGHFYGEIRVVPLCLRGACENHVWYS